MGKLIERILNHFGYIKKANRRFKQGGPMPIGGYGMPIRMSYYQMVDILVANGYEVKDEEIRLPGGMLEVAIPYLKGKVIGPSSEFAASHKYSLVEIQVENILQRKIVQFLKL